ncbi:hypothetical protein HK102_011561, partial [Quaeritorhiza haematococci]
MQSPRYDDLVDDLTVPSTPTAVSPGSSTTSLFPRSRIIPNRVCASEFGGSANVNLNGLTEGQFSLADSELGATMSTIAAGGPYQE